MSLFISYEVMLKMFAIYVNKFIADVKTNGFEYETENKLIIEDQNSTS